MNLLQAIFLGALQGLAEFLPVSSSGHLSLASHFMKLEEVPFLFDILLHLSTLCAVIIFYRVRIGELFVSLWRFLVRKNGDEDRGNLRLIVAILAGTVVTAGIGFAIKDVAAEFPPALISLCLAVTGVLLLVSGRYAPKKTTDVPTLVQALIVGAAQGIGVLPGISRSGSTISASLLSGVNRQSAGEFSFLLSIPAILGAFILELKDADTLSGAVTAAPLIAGMATSFAVGYLSLRVLTGLIKKGKLSWFALYLIPAGIALAIYFGVA